MSPLELTLLGAFLGFAATTIVALTVERLKLPALSIQPLETQLIRLQVTGQNVNECGRFVHVRIHNKKRELGFLPDTAATVTARIDFHPLNGQPLKNPTMAGRWASSHEPVPICIVGATGEIIAQFRDPLVFDSIRRMEIFPGETETLNVAVRFDNDVNCYGWCNENYLRGWRDSRREMPSGKYRVAVHVYSPGVHVVREFILRNDGDVADFRLEAVSKEPDDDVFKDFCLG
jgi:hypothetical protein